MALVLVLCSRLRWYEEGEGGSFSQQEHFPLALFSQHFVSRDMTEQLMILLLEIKFRGKRDKSDK